MQDLNDLFFFTEVVAQGGFSQAGRALRQPKSKLSRRVAQLEERLGVRLIERSSRRFRVTDVGRAFYKHCRNVMTEVKRAEEAVAATQGEPHGLVRLSCPLGLMEEVSPLLADFLARHPRVNLQVVATNRRVDLIHERIDIAIRVRTTLDTDAAFMLRTLARSRRILVASPALVPRLGDLRNIALLASWPTLSTSEEPGQDVWELVGPEERTVSVRHEPRLTCGDFGALRTAAVAGLGIAMLPEHTCASALRSGQLVQVLPDWHAPDGTVHLVFTARRGLPPPVAALLDHLTERFRERSPLKPEP
ncbi:LysR substrate-binding domain-containing protein [Archangium lansingense]|uniref:LysR substrate-binding domain-containing protein n=1 Tax=Archangium lansingense TaxID=2995310 RepID=UPI003B80FD03